MAERPAAVVADAGWMNGLAAVRSLGRAGLTVIALDQRRSALGFRSRYARARLCPDPGRDEAGYLEALAGLGDELGEPAPILPTHDEHLNAIARGRRVLGERFLYPFPDWERLGPIQSKRHQLEQAQAAGVDVPRTLHPRSGAEALAAADELGYPLLVKPAQPVGFRARFGRQAFRCTDRGALERAFAQAEPFEPMVQELVPGGDSCLWTLGSYLRRDGTALGLFCGRKLRQTAPPLGVARVAEAAWDERVVAAGLALLRRLGFHGISQVELKRDPRDGRFKLMEVNPRLWLWHGLAAACGVDLPLIAYRDLTGEAVAPVRSQGCRRRWAVTLMQGASPAPQRPPYVDAALALDDPRPALVQTLRVGRAALRGLHASRRPRERAA